MEKVISGKSFRFSLNNDGFIECNELGVSAETYSECLKLAEKKYSEIKENARKNKGVVAIYSSWNIFEQCTVGTEDGYKVWITRADGSRSKEDKRSIFIFNQTILDEVGSIRSQIKELEGKELEVKEKLVKLFPGVS